MHVLLQKLLTWPQDLIHACIAAEAVVVLSTYMGQSMHAAVPGDDYPDVSLVSRPYKRIQYHLCDCYSLVS